MRGIKERQKKRELFSVISERINKENELSEIMRKKGEVAEEFSSSHKNDGGIPAFFLAYFLDYIEGLREEERKKREELKILNEKEEIVRSEYIDTKRELEVAERLFDRVKAFEFRERSKREEKFSDEVVIIKKAREREEE